MHHKVAHSEHSILRKFNVHFVLGRSLELLTGFEPVYHLKDCVRSTYTCNYAGGNWIRGQRRPKYYVCTLLSVRKRVGGMKGGIPPLQAKNRQPPSLLEWTWHTPFPWAYKLLSQQININWDSFDLLHLGLGLGNLSDAPFTWALTSDDDLCLGLSHYKTTMSTLIFL